MKESEILSKIAQLEFIHDQLTAEIAYLDELLRAVGFPNGIAFAKAVALEMLEGSTGGEYDYEEE